MVETQLDHLSKAVGRHASRSARRGQREDRRFIELLPLLRRPERLVVVYAEANAHPREDRDAGVPELLHLVAARPLVPKDAPDAHFEVLCRPRRRLHASITERLGLELGTIEAGVDVDTALDRFRDYLGDGRLVCWGAFPRDLLTREGDSKRGFVDLRALACRALGGPAGGLDRAAERLGVDVAADPWRARRMIAAAAGIVRALAAMVDAPDPPTPSA